MNFSMFLFYFWIDHGKTWHLNTPMYGLPYAQEKIAGDFTPGENQVAMILKLLSLFAS